MVSLMKNPEFIFNLRLGVHAKVHYFYDKMQKYIALGFYNLTQAIHFCVFLLGWR